jgi:hypothetical protein
MTLAGSSINGEALPIDLAGHPAIFSTCHAMEVRAGWFGFWLARRFARSDPLTRLRKAGGIS